MRVLQLGPFPPPEGGVSRNILALRTQLRASGDGCSILVTARPERIVPEEGVYHPSSAGALIGLLRSLDYDVLHLHVGGDITGRLIRLMAACCVLGKGQKVLTMHSGGFATSKEALTAKPASVRGAVFRMFDRVISVNKDLAAVFAAYGVPSERNRVIAPHALRSPDPKAALPPRLGDFVSGHDPFLLTIGSLETGYDLFTQIEAMAGVLERKPDAGLMVIGSGALEEELRKAIDSKPYAGRILLAGNVDHDLSLLLIREADALLRTTLFDGDAIAIREALFLGTKVIATDNGMRPDGVDLIPMRDAAALARAVVTAPGKAGGVSQPAGEDVSNIVAVVELYREVLGLK